MLISDTSSSRWLPGAVYQPCTLLSLFPQDSISSISTVSKTTETTDTVTSVTSVSGDNMTSQRHLEEHRKRMEKEQRAFRMIAFVIGFFLLCWIPWIVLWPLIAFSGNVPDEVYSFCVWMQYLNSAVNPFLYVFSNADFRAAVWRLLCPNRVKKN